MTDPWQFDEGKKTRRYWAFRRKFRLRDVVVPFGLFALVTFLPILVGPDPWRHQHPFAAFWIWTAWFLCTTLMPPGRVLGYQVEADGLRCRRSFRRSQVVPWERITGVDIQADHAVVQTLDGPIRLAEPVWMWQELAEQVRAKLAEAEAPEEGLPAGQVATWLGIAEDGMLRAGYPDVRHSRDARRIVARLGFVFLPMLPFLLLFALMRGPWTPWWVIAPFLVIMAVELPLVALTMRNRILHMPIALEADVRGLTLRAGNGRARFHPWAGLHSIRREKKVVYFLTERGRFMLPANWPGLDQVIAAAKRVLAEREAGRVVPRMEGLPEAGLSRAEVGVAVDRGLSREES